METTAQAAVQGCEGLGAEKLVGRFGGDLNALCLDYVTAVIQRHESCLEAEERVALGGGGGRGGSSSSSLTLVVVITFVVCVISCGGGGKRVEDTLVIEVEL